MFQYTSRVERDPHLAGDGGEEGGGEGEDKQAGDVAETVDTFEDQECCGGEQELGGHVPVGG